jgi:hypothetical protein
LTRLMSLNGYKILILEAVLRQSVFTMRQKRSFCKRFYDGIVKFETEPNMGGISNI